MIAQPHLWKCIPKIESPRNACVKVVTSKDYIILKYTHSRLPIVIVTF